MEIYVVNLIPSECYLPSFKKFGEKNVVTGFDVRDKFSYWNFVRFMTKF
jgi:hypothetical protein